MTAALIAEQRTSLEKLIQKARRLIEEDLEETLEGTFGINADGRIEPESGVSLSNAELAVRADLVEIVEFLRSEGEGEAGSVARLIREAAFTHTNRLVAVRVAEAIGLLPETMAKGTSSSGFRDFSELAPTVATTEWGRFAEFVRLCADELAADVPALFDPRNPLLELAMSETVLAKVVGAIGELGHELWAAPDALGWAYQFFNTGDERKEMRESSAPRNSRELAVRNQFFTPSYVVEFLVHNGLGAHLAAGFPGLADDLPLLVEVPTEQTEVDLEAVSVLDPACGSGHFLLGAYDVLEKAWQLAGVEPADAAPAIVRSLWGIDIDPRATQIAQVAVMFRARRHCRDEKLPVANVICARSLPAGPEVDALIASLPGQVGRAVAAITDELVDAPILGSLLKIEERLSREVRDVFGTGVVEGTLSEGAASEAENVEAAVLEALSAVADSTTSTAFQRLFAAEAHDAVRFVEAMSRRYTTVLMNPPFGQVANGSQDYVKEAYPDDWTEIYACFLTRAVELSITRVSAITSSTFLTIKRLRNLRQRIQELGLPICVDLGPGVLHGATVETALTVIGSTGSTTMYLDLVSSASREEGLGAAVARGRFTPKTISNFAALPNSPFAFHASDEILSLWADNRTLDPGLAIVRTGGKTFDNFRYLRLWWELGDDALERGWEWYEKGGEFQPFVAATPLLLNWKEDGRELREYGEQAGRLAQVMQSSSHWRLPGLCYPRMGKAFSVRVLPEGEVFADTSIAVLPHRSELRVPILAFLNSSAVSDVLEIFGRGRSTENNSVKSIPTRTEWMEDPQISQVGEKLIELYLELEESSETSPLFRCRGATGWKDRLKAASSRVRSLQCELDDLARRKLGNELARSADGRERFDRESAGADLFDARAREITQDASVVSLGIGLALGRWEVDDSDRGHAPKDVWKRLQLPRESIQDGAPKYLLDQAGHAVDIADLLWSVLGAELTRAFGDVAKLRRYIRRSFFGDHLKTYSMAGRKAPIYWPLQVPSRRWGVFLHARVLDREVLFAVVREAEQRQRLAEQQIGHLQRETETGSGGRKASEVAKELDAEQMLAAELEAFRAEAERIANLGWEPDLDDGMVLNAAPLADLFPAWKDAAKYRKELRAGKYEWATVAQYADQL